MNKNRAIKKWILIAVCCAAIAFVIPIVTVSFLAKDSGDLVIVLDPGHGGADVGAVSDDGRLYESDLNLAIALACREELEKYDGVQVYMTHTGLDYSSTLSLNDRINYVNDVDGDILISLHCNDAENSSAAGSEVYVSHSSYKESYNQNSTELAIGILKNFGDLGMRIRGVKTRLSNGSRMYYHDDGSVEVGDYYAVIGGTIKKYGIPGILVEHGFVTGDEGFLSKADNLTALGVADATAIAEHYGLELAGMNDEPMTDNVELSEEPEAVIITDSDIISASDVTNRIMSLTAMPSVEYYDDMQQTRRDYEHLSVPAKTLIEQSYVDTLYKTLIQLDAQLYPVRLSIDDYSALTVNRLTHAVTGIEPARGAVSGTTVAELSSALKIFVDPEWATEEQSDTAGAFIIIVDEQGNTLDIGAPAVTGTRAQLWKDGELLDELTVVIDNDVSCDGIIDSLDQYTLEDYLYQGKPLSEAAMLAADANGDGVVNADDIEAIVSAIISQKQE